MDRPKRVYLAGPMRGIPEFNFPAFHVAAAQLRALGCEVFSPAERDESQYGPGFTKGNKSGSELEAIEEHGFDLREALACDLEYICKHADAIALLPGWEKSSGVAAELATAKALHLEVLYL